MVFRFCDLIKYPGIFSIDIIFLKTVHKGLVILQEITHLESFIEVIETESTINNPQLSKKKEKQV